MSANEETPVIGKHILSTLTIGMYQDPRMIYREYIQNSADQIDTLSEDDLTDKLRQTIVIDIDEQGRRVEITDRATGIPQKDFRTRLLNVADSRKDPSKNKGFRGIGRLAGLNYCKRLVFETSAQGETVVSRLEMDGSEMIRILHDSKDRSAASEVMEKISKVTYLPGKEKSYECWFKVILEDVRMDVGKGLLDVDSVKEFIAQIAPVPFSVMKFKSSKEVVDEARKAGVRVEEYTVRVNGVTITKLYKDDLYDANGHRFGTVGKPVYRLIEWQGKPLAWGWFILPVHGISLAGSTNPERKIRLRKGNIQIGFEDFLDSYFPEARSNGYMLGEIHLLSDNILPNGDRNALEVSEEAAALQNRLKDVYFKDLWGAAHKANELKNAKKAMEDYEQLHGEYKKLAQEGIDVGHRKTELDKAFEKAAAGQRKMLKAAETSVKGEFVKGVVDAWTNESECGKATLNPPSVPVEVKPKPKDAPRCEVKTTSDKLVNAIVKVLTDNGMDVMQAFGLANKINEEVSAPSR